MVSPLSAKQEVEEQGNTLKPTAMKQFSHQSSFVLHAIGAYYFGQGVSNLR